MKLRCLFTIETFNSLPNNKKNYIEQHKGNIFWNDFFLMRETNIDYSRKKNKIEIITRKRLICGMHAVVNKCCLLNAFLTKNGMDTHALIILNNTQLTNFANVTVLLLYHFIAFPGRLVIISSFDAIEELVFYRHVIFTSDDILHIADLWIELVRGHTDRGQCQVQGDGPVQRSVFLLHFLSRDQSECACIE